MPHNGVRLRYFPGNGKEVHEGYADVFVSDTVRALFQVVDGCEIKITFADSTGNPCPPPTGLEILDDGGQIPSSIDMHTAMCFYLACDRDYTVQVDGIELYTLGKQVVMNLKGSPESLDVRASAFKLLAQVAAEEAASIT